MPHEIRRFRIEKLEERLAPALTDVANVQGLALLGAAVGCAAAAFRLTGEPNRPAATPKRLSRLARPCLEGMEVRVAPAVFTASTVAALQADVAAANTNGDATNTINLTAGTYTLTAAMTGDTA